MDYTTVEELRQIPRVVAWLCPVCGVTRPQRDPNCCCNSKERYPEPGADPTDDWVADLDRDAMPAAIAAASDVLNGQQRAVLWRRFGLNGERPCTRAAIATGLNVSTERARQIEVAALKKLARPLAGWR